MDHQQSWDILICHGQTSAGKLADLAESNYTVVFGKISTSTGRDGKDTSAGGFPQVTCWKQRHDCFQASRFHAGFGVEFVPPLLLSQPIFQTSSQTSDWSPCPASPHLIPPDPSCSFPFQSLPFSTPTPRLHVPSLLIELVSVPPGSASALCFLPLLTEADMAHALRPRVPLQPTSPPGLRGPKSSLVWPSLRAPPGAPLQARSGELGSRVEQTWCQANWKSCDYVRMALSPS